MNSFLSLVREHYCCSLNLEDSFLGIQTVRIALDNLGRLIRSILDYISRSKIQRGEMTV